jgi:thymidine phosphorylase
MKISKSNTLAVKSLGIETYRENIIFMRADCQVCLSEGFTALTRVVIHYRGKRIVATLNVVHSELIHHYEAGLSIEAMKRLGLSNGDIIEVNHLSPINSLSKVRAKMYGRKLIENDYREIITDVVLGNYSNIELAAFIASCSGPNLSVEEIGWLTKAMINSGERIDWGQSPVFDKHSVGGLPGNRTTPIVVSIIAAAGLTIPKTSSRAITSPAGTADTMETMTVANLSIEQIKRVVEKENGCLAWGGGVMLSPADDILISIEKALDVDSEGQMVASVLSKKVAAGSTHVVVDIPVGPTAKVRSLEEALRLQYYFKATAEAVGLVIEIMISDGTQPVGRGIGPSLEAMDVLSVLRNEAHAPADLKSRAAALAGALLEMAGKYPKGKGAAAAVEFIENGTALKKFMDICEAQGGFKEPLTGKYKFDVVSQREGIVSLIDNRKLARVAKLAGAPRFAQAGLKYFSPLGKKVQHDDVLFTVYSEAAGQLEYAREYLSNNPEIITIA